MALKRIGNKVNESEIRPVHPRNTRFHGLLGIPFFRQHFVYDKNYQHRILTDQFGGMADVLTKRRDFYNLEYKSLYRQLDARDKKLKNLGRDGRTKLQMTLMGNNSMKIRNILINHRDMQRLYQNMPLHVVVEKIDQQSFVLRKERDRLVCRTKQLESELDTKLMEGARIESRIKYQNNFVLDEQTRAEEFQKKISNSAVRLQAIKYLNSAYKKMLHVLEHDAAFYEPIIRSLEEDSEDQSKFIKHILTIGTPAISRFKELSVEYKNLDEEGRNTLLDRPLVISKRSSQYEFANKEKAAFEGPGLEAPEKIRVNRYVRETESMMVLKNEMQQIETVIKQIKFSTLCSKAKEIYPRIKIQKENNKSLVLQSNVNLLTHEALTQKHKRAEIVFDSLIHNLDEHELKRQHCIRFMEKEIIRLDKAEADMIKQLKYHSELHILIRYSLWNIHELLRHIDRVPQKPRLQYPNTYLKLPLLMFEMLTMHAVPPDVLDENVINLANSAITKLKMLTQALRTEPTPTELKSYLASYHTAYIEGLDEDIDDDKPSRRTEPDVENDSEGKLELKNRVPTNKMMKQLSSKIVEEFAKKENE